MTVQCEQRMHRLLGRDLEMGIGIYQPCLCLSHLSTKVSVFLLTQSHSLVKEMATHSSTLFWKNPWVEEPGRLQSMGS